MRTAITLVTGTCFCLVLLAGCGGTSDKQATGVGDEFASRALAVCEAALDDKHGWQPFPVGDFDPSDPDASKFPEVSTWLAKQVAPTFRMWLGGLKALGTPPTARADWNAVLAAVKKIDQLNSDQITAANERDARGIRGGKLRARLDTGRACRRVREGRRSRLRRRPCRVASDAGTGPNVAPSGRDPSGLDSKIPDPTASPVIQSATNTQHPAAPRQEEAHDEDTTHTCHRRRNRAGHGVDRRRRDSARRTDDPAPRPSATT